MDKDFFKDQKLITLFIRQLCTLPDTPSLIQFVAGDEDYMQLCSRIVNASADDSQELQALKKNGREHGLGFQVLKEKLTPVALALGLAVSSENQSNYYELLGVSSDARKADIKKAFRQQVRKVHPDTSGQIIDNGQDFIHLKAAYQILSDPVLRQQYDKTLHDDNLWKEKTDQSMIQKRPGRTKIFYQLGVLFLLMILAVFIFDFLYRQNSILEGDPTVNQKQVTERKILKEGSEKESNTKTRPQNKSVKLLRYETGRTHSILPADDPTRKAKQKAHGEVSTHGPNKVNFEIGLPN